MLLFLATPKLIIESGHKSLTSIILFTFNFLAKLTPSIAVVGVGDDAYITSGFPISFIIFLLAIFVVY